MLKIDNLLKRKPSKWGNLTVKEFERDIKLLQNTYLLLNEAIEEDNEIKERLLKIIDDKAEEITELKSLNLWSARRLHNIHKEFAYNEYEKITGEKPERL